MSFLKSLKKKLTIKNVLKGAKSALKIIPGGSIIEQGIKVLEGAAGEAKKVFGKADTKGTKAQVQPSGALEAVGTAKSNKNMMLLLAGGAVLFFLITKKK